MFNRNFLKEIAKKEKVSLAFLEKQLKNGQAVIPLNAKRKIKIPPAIGKGFKIKVNTNIGTSTEKNKIKEELEKLKIAITRGTDTVMDLSTGGNLRAIRKEILRNSSVPLGTVPVYEAAQAAEIRDKNLDKMTFDDIWDVLKSQAEDGVDFFTIHAGILKSFLKIVKKQTRIGGIVSRGGAMLTRWMYVNNRENPFYENFDKILDLAKAYNIVLSLGDGMRPGAVYDSTDDLQISELVVLGELVKKCRKQSLKDALALESL